MSIKRFDVGSRMSQAVVHGNTVYLAGQVARNAPDGSVAEQTKDILAIIDRLLAAGRQRQVQAPERQHLACRHRDLQRDERGLGRLGRARQHAMPRLRREQAGVAAIQRRDHGHRGARLIPLTCASRFWVPGSRASPQPGICTQDGHEVTVVDRQPQAALETSFANAGLISTGHAFAWASPRAVRVMLKSLFLRDQPLRLRLSADPAFWRWTLKFLGQCTTERAHANTRIKHRLCRYAQQALHEVIAATGIAYDGSRGGLLYSTAPSNRSSAASPTCGSWQEGGHEIEVVDRDRAAAIDPALAPSKSKIAGGIYCPTDESGDAHKFTQALAALCAERGVRFLFDTTVQRLEAAGDRVERVVTDRGELAADTLRPGARQLQPAPGPIARRAGSGLSGQGLLGDDPDERRQWRADHRRHRRGQSLRLYAPGRSGPGHLGRRVRGLRHQPPAGRLPQHARRAAGPVSRTPAIFRQPRYWACLRPMTPDGPPIVGRGRYRNLYYDTGHGHMGWTMSCGTARIIADLIAGRAPEVPLDGLTLR